MNEDLHGQESFLVKSLSILLIPSLLLYARYVDSFIIPVYLLYFLGLPAKEIHVCGSVIAADIVKSIVESVGEQIEVRHYDRLLPLVTLNESLGKFN